MLTASVGDYQASGSYVDCTAQPFTSNADAQPFGYARSGMQLQHEGAVAHLSTLERQIAVVGCPAVGHDLWQRDALAWVLAQHARDEVLQPRRHCWLVGKRDGLSANDVVQPHDAGVLERYRPCSL